MGPLGGASGRILADLAAAEGLAAAWTWCEVETRSCLILVDSAARQATVINEAGPRLPPGTGVGSAADVLARAADARAVCLSGSLPPGVAAEGLAELCRSLVESGQAPWVDSSGAALAAAPLRRRRAAEDQPRGGGGGARPASATAWPRAPGPRGELLATRDGDRRADSRCRRSGARGGRGLLARRVAARSRPPAPWRAETRSSPGSSRR